MSEAEAVENRARASWSDEVGLTDNEWGRFVALRARLQGEPVACPWCIDGQFGTSNRPVSCPACDASGMTNQWVALHAPLEDEWYADSEDTLLAWPLPDAFAPLRSRLDGLTVRCPRCEGSRRERRGRCRSCDGVGRLGALKAALYHEVRCPHCGGPGSVGMCADRRHQ